MRSPRWRTAHAAGWWLAALLVLVSVSVGSPLDRRPASAVVADPVIAAAGDIACDPASSAFNGGEGTSSDCVAKHTGSLLVGVDAVLPLGDLQYECGGRIAFASSYDRSWGVHKAITRPVPGNHEYSTSGGTDCSPAGDAAGYFDYFGAAAGHRDKGYYSYDLGASHVVA